MARKVKWGVLGVARIATKKVIPAMQIGEYSEVVAIASCERSKAEQAAKSLGIAKAYGSYEELLADPDIDAVYNPLPNHLHVPWSILAAEAGKHVLCEKPIGLSVAETRRLIEVRDRTGVKFGIEIPFNAPPDQPCRIAVETGADGVLYRELPVCDQYTIQGDLFSRAILDDTKVPTPLEDSIRNMAVIEAIFRSAESGEWEVLA